MVWLSQKLASSMFEAGIFRITLDKPVPFSSGILSPVYCDNRLFMSDVGKRELIIGGFLDLVRGKEYDLLAGVATAGIPWCSYLADRLKREMIYVRSAPKEHGKKASIEGRLEPGKKVIVIEDLISTGESSLQVVRQIRDAGGVVHHCFGIFTYEFPGVYEKFQKAQCELTTLTNLTTLIHIGEGEGRISSAEKEAVFHWRSNPYRV